MKGGKEKEREKRMMVEIEPPADSCKRDHPAGEKDIGDRRRRRFSLRAEIFSKIGEGFDNILFKHSFLCVAKKTRNDLVVSTNNI